MKLRLSIPLLLTSLFLGLFLLTSTSCSQRTYSPNNRVSYNRSSYIKAYKKPDSRKSFTHKGTVRKKYVLKKKRR
ncbi:MAG: hypothetical protein V2I47_03685 [Bacteroidales bacterium]|nr:hypothetical protein [Bacteroidales bacterium]